MNNFLKYLAEGTATDEYTRKLVKAVETAYAEVIQNEEYADCTREEVRKYYESVN